jgi:hypothetical protein
VRRKGKADLETGNAKIGAMQEAETLRPSGK